MSDFTPRLEIVPASQRQLWPALREVPGHYVLYGGSALVLRLGHRQSEDFDSFSAHGFVPERPRRALPFADGGEIRPAAANHVTLRPSGRDGVTCSVVRAKIRLSYSELDQCPQALEHEVQDLGGRVLRLGERVEGCGRPRAAEPGK